MVGILTPDRYSPRASAVFLNLLRTVFPDFTANTLRIRREGRCFRPLERAIAATKVRRARRPRPPHSRAPCRMRRTKA